MSLAASLLILIAPEPIVPPALWLKDSDYPDAAHRLGEEGTVGVTIEVDAKGQPSDCTVTSTSNSDTLDSVTCAIIMREARFRPEQDVAGVAIPSKYRTRVKWVLPDLKSITSGQTAVIFDWPAEQAKPECRVETVNMRPGDWSDCEDANEDADLLAQLAPVFKKIVFLVARYPAGGSGPTIKPEWGQRISHAASEQMLSKGSAPVSCKSIAADGMMAGKNMCDTISVNNRPISQTEKVQAQAAVFEQSIYAVPR